MHMHAAAAAATPTLRPLNLPGHPFAFGCAGPAEPELLDEFTGWLLGVLKPTALATMAFDSGSGPGGWNGNGSASVYIKHHTPVLYYPGLSRIWGRDSQGSAATKFAVSQERGVCLSWRNIMGSGAAPFK